MSIQIVKSDCTGCKRCVEVCPGNLIKTDVDGKAVIRREKDCWGCTSCIKECRYGAIRFFLGADIGGKGSLLSVHEDGPLRIWTVTDTAGQKKTITVNKKESNKY
jgi:adenylylsulfate reductase subunit B